MGEQSACRGARTSTNVMGGACGSKETKAGPVPKTVTVKPAPAAAAPAAPPPSVPVKAGDPNAPGINTTLEKAVIASNPGTSTLINEVNDTPSTAAEKAEAGQVGK